MKSSENTGRCVNKLCVTLLPKEKENHIIIEYWLTSHWTDTDMADVTADIWCFPDLYIPV